MFAKIVSNVPFAIVAALAIAVASQDIPSASAEGGILTVSGGSPKNISVDLDLQSIERMPIHQVVTSTPWTEGVSRFDGVLLRDLLRQLGIVGSTIRLAALNDYSVTIPLSDIESYDVILAYARNGEVMSIRDKGPLWVIYPLDDHPELNVQEIHAKMIWQVRRMDIM